MEKMLNLTLDEKQFIAGFLDGDGYICNKGSFIRAGIVQASHTGIAEILTWCMSRFGGSIGKMKAPKTANWRQCHHWRLSSSHDREMRYVLGLMRTHGIVKAPQAALCLNFMDSARTDDLKKEFTVQLKQLKKEYADVPIPLDRLTMAYCSGLFDAEGCVRIRNGKRSVQTTVAQACCPRLLEAMAAFLGGDEFARRNKTAGKNGGIMEIKPKSTFICDILPFSIMKREQLALAHEVREIVVNKKRNMSETDMVRIDTIREDIMHLKGTDLLNPRKKAKIS